MLLVQNGRQPTAPDRLANHKVAWRTGFQDGGVPVKERRDRGASDGLGQGEKAHVNVWERNASSPAHGEERCFISY